MGELFNRSCPSSEPEGDMRTIALYNSKGGVGKTTAAVNLAYLAARDGLRTLLWDLDPQGAASYCLRIEPQLKGGSKRMLKNDPGEHVMPTDYPDLALLPADFSNRNLDLRLDAADKPERTLHKRIKRLADDYDLLVFDCPPSISRVSESVFYAADALLVPVIPAVLSLRTLDRLSEFVNRKSRFGKVRILPFPSMVDRRRRLHCEILEQLAMGRPESLRTAIPYASEIERMAEQRAPLPVFASRSRATRAFIALWRELGQRLPT